MKQNIKEKLWHYRYCGIAILVVVLLGVAVGGVSFNNDDTEDKKAVKGENLTLSAVKELSQKGEQLTAKDFKKYNRQEGGDDLYIRRFGIDENFYLMIGNKSWDAEVKPYYIRLCRREYTEGEKGYIDIRTEKVDDFVAKYSHVDGSIAGEEKLTLNAVKELSKKGEQLSWEDFNQYSGQEVGSGLYIRHYDIDEDYYLLIGGAGPHEKPDYIYLCNQEGEEIDIRTKKVERFVAKNNHEN